MQNGSGEKIVYIAHPGSGLARSNFPLKCVVKDNRIVRCLPFYIPDEVKLYTIKTSRGEFKRPRKDVQMPLAYAWKRRIDTDDRLRYPLLRKDWKPEAPNTERRGISDYARITWDEALDIIVQQLKRVHEKYGNMEPVLVQADGHGQSGYMQSLHFWGHYLFDKIHDELGWGWWTQQIRNPDSWEGYYWGAKHVWGFEESLGEPYQDEVWDDVLENTEMVIFSGNDPESTGFGMSGSISTIMARWLKDAGIKIVAVSPDLNYAAAVYADKWIPIKPNTDSALYLSIAYVWISENLYDRDYVDTHTIGFDQFEKHVKGEDDGIPKTPEWATSITGLPVHTIKALAREWARKRTSLSVYFGGPKVRGTLSHMAARHEAYLLAMQGIGKPGRQFLRTGAPSFYKKWLAQVPRFPEVDREGIPLNPLIDYAIGKEAKSPVFIPRTLVDDAILKPPIHWQGSSAALANSDDQFVKYHFPPDEKHPGIRMIWNENGNQPVSWTYGRKWIDALRSPNIDFVVSIHPWMENDVLFSDLILPAQTIFEHEDIIAVQRSDILGMFFQERAIEPIGESKSDYEIHRMVAQRLGIKDGFPPHEEWLREAYEEKLAFRKYGISWEEFKQRKYIIYDCPSWEEWLEIKKGRGDGPHEGGLAWFNRDAKGLQTPSGKIEFVSERIKKSAPDDKERPPLAKWVASDELQTSEKAKKYPYLVVANHPRFRFHVQGDDIDWIREMWKMKGPDGYEYEPCWIHPEIAYAKGISNGDVVRVYNERGSVLFCAKVTERITPGTVYAEHGSKMDLYSVKGELVDRGGNINFISPSPGEKYRRGEEIKIPEMNVSGFLVDVERIDPAEFLDLGNSQNLKPGVPLREAD